MTTLLQRVSSALSRSVPTCALLQFSSLSHWLTEADEPFAELLLHARGDRATLSFTPHCSPQWSAITTAALIPLFSRLLVSPIPFIQTHTGSVLRGPSADHYWDSHRLLFSSPAYAFPS